ncbi:MAG: hypothetical protein KAG19_03245 [Methylococcales bacterium]|nr:hypothetical protein [Methylococcales bacterium]
MPKTKYKQITEPDHRGFQVRIVRNKKEYSRYFSHKMWGSKIKSLKSAISWRDQMLVLFKEDKKYQQESPIPPHKKSTGVLGVSKSIQYDKRRGVHYLVYSCHWRKNGHGHTKTFHVGRADNVSTDEELHAFRTAVLFRKEYEVFKEKDKVSDFLTDKYKDWKKERLYDGNAALA